MNYGRYFALLALTCGLLPATPAFGAPELDARSKASAPPAQLLTLLRRIDETPYRLANAAPGWKVASPCPSSDRERYCNYFTICSGLARAYVVPLRDREAKWQWLSTSLWAWDFTSEAHARRAEAVFRDYWCLFSAKTIVWREGKLLLVAETSTPSSAARQRATQQHEALQKLLGTSPSPVPPRPARQALDAAGRAKLADLTLPDAELPTLVGGTDDLAVLKALNARGMRFYKQRDYGRAAYAFELAARLGETSSASSALSVYNRACVAGLQHDLDEALFWLWKLTKLPHGRAIYCQSRTDEGDKLLQRAAQDKDLREVFNAPAGRAFTRCLAPDSDGRW